MSVKTFPNPRKIELRKDVDSRLVAMTEEDRRYQSNVILAKILQNSKYKQAKRIALFISLPTEVDTQPILNDILLRGDTLFVPQYFKGKMRMLRVMPGDLDTMPKTSWGIKQHSKEANREDAMETGGLDLVITPGAAFTSSGWRVGHGGGYYDRYLTELKKRYVENAGAFLEPYVLAVGFKQQIYEDVPVDPHDVQVDEVIIGN